MPTSPNPRHWIPCVQPQANRLSRRLITGRNPQAPTPPRGSPPQLGPDRLFRRCDDAA